MSLWRFMCIWCVRIRSLEARLVTEAKADVKGARADGEELWVTCIEDIAERGGDFDAFVPKGVTDTCVEQSVGLRFQSLKFTITIGVLFVWVGADEGSADGESQPGLGDLEKEVGVSAMGGSSE